MALYENKITLKGFLGKDAETFATRNQKTFVVLSLATQSGYKDQQTQEWANRTEWHRVVAFGKSADDAKHLKKGNYVKVEGELRSTEREKEIVQGKSKFRVTLRDKEVRANLVKKLSAPAKSENLDAPITEDNAA
jgi:single-strand DNA-binding protein